MLKHLVLAGCLCLCFPVYSQNFHGHLADLGDHTPFKALMETFKQRYKKGHLTYQTLPFNRSLKGIIDGKADFHVPIIKAQGKKGSKPGFTFSTVTVGNVIFALYVNKANKKININNYNSGEFLIETDAAHYDFYDFKSVSSNCPKCSLQKVNSGRVDGYIYSALLVNAIVSQNKAEFSNLDSYFHEMYEIKFGIPFGERGKTIDSVLTTYIGGIIEDGTFDKLQKDVLDFNKNWKPTRK